MRIAILGMHRDTLDFDRARYNEIWGLAHAPNAFTLDRVFESHSEEIVRQHGPRHISRLQEIAEFLPLYTPWRWSEKLGPNHIVLPHKRLHDITEQFESSVAYPMALAIQNRPQEIGIYGINMAGDDEYAYQRPNMQYLIGYARAKGIEVTLHPASRLFESQWTAGIYGHPGNINDIDYRLTR